MLKGHYGLIAGVVSGELLFRVAFRSRTIANKLDIFQPCHALISKSIFCFSEEESGWALSTRGSAMERNVARANAILGSFVIDGDPVTKLIACTLLRRFCWQTSSPNVSDLD